MQALTAIFTAIELVVHKTTKEPREENKNRKVQIHRKTLMHCS